MLLTIHSRIVDYATEESMLRHIILQPSLLPQEEHQNDSPDIIQISCGGCWVDLMWKRENS
jgi:hypothetical protein